MADIIEQAEQGALPPAAGLWYENYRETEEARREAKADKAEREATAEEQARITSRWNVRAARIAAGVDTSLTVEDVTEAFESGELGVDELGLPSTEAFTLFSRLRSAISAGQQERLEAPEVQAGLEVFDAHVQTQQGEGGIVGLATGGGSAGAITVSRPVYVRAIEDIKANIKDGMSVSEAVQKGIDWAKKYGEVPGTIPGVTSGLSSSEASRLEELESRSLGE